MEELGENGLRIYTFPTEDATVAENNNKMNVSDIHSFSCVHKIFSYKN